MLCFRDLPILRGLVLRFPGIAADIAGRIAAVVKAMGSEALLFFAAFTNMPMAGIVHSPLGREIVLVGQGRLDHIAAGLTGLGLLLRGLRAGDVLFNINLIPAGFAGMIVIQSIFRPSLLVTVGSLPGQAADITIRVTIVVISVLGALGDHFGLFLFTAAAAIGSLTGLLTGGLLQYLNGLPNVVAGNGFAADLTDTLVLRFVYIIQRIKLMVIGRLQFGGLFCTAFGTEKFLLTGFFTVGFFYHCAVVPAMLFCINVATSAAGPLMVSIVSCSEP